MLLWTFNLRPDPHDPLKTLVVNGVTSSADPVSGTIISAVAGGVGSMLGGGKFESGAVTGAFSYLFNCLSHPGTCTKADQPEIRKAAATCGNDSPCIQRLASYARESGIPLPPDMAQSLKDFLDITTLPTRLFTPAGRIADDVIDAAKFVVGSTSERWGIAGAAFYEKAMERATRVLDVPGITQAISKISGKVFEAFTQNTAEEAIKK